MVSAVDASHRAGVAHLDLKLENFVLTACGKIKLIDFGLSHVYHLDANTGEYDRSTPLQNKGGSRHYIAPEVLTGKGYDGFRADVWSLGICLFAMIFNGLFKYSHKAKASPTSAFKKSESEEVCDLIDRMLVLDPASRLTIAQIEDHEWIDRSDNHKAQTLLTFKPVSGSDPESKPDSPVTVTTAVPPPTF